jgi:hypothetical protein
VLEANGLTTLPVCPFALAEKHDIVVRTRKSGEPGVTGFLMRIGQEFGVYYASHIDNDGFIRFTVAHELGHYFIPGHPQALFPNGDGIHASRAWNPTGDRYEKEADGFASGLLMPRELFVAEMRELQSGFAAIESLASTCRTSITSTAIRYARFADDPVAVVVSTGALIDYCFMSDAIRRMEGVTWIGKGESLPPRCETRKFNSTSSNVSSGRKAYGWASMDDWFEGAPQVEMKEDVVGLGSYGKTLTVLFTDQAIDDDEID